MNARRFTARDCHEFGAAHRGAEVIAEGFEPIRAELSDEEVKEQFGVVAIYRVTDSPCGTSSVAMTSQALIALRPAKTEPSTRAYRRIRGFPPPAWPRFRRDPHAFRRLQ